MNDEPKKKRGRPRTRPYTSILSDAQVAEIRGDTRRTETDTEASERRRKDAERKRQERLKERTDKELESATSYQELWTLNRATIPEAELNALLERQERVWNLCLWITDNVNGTYIQPSDELYVSITEGTADIYVHVHEHGVVNVELILIPEYWKITDLYQRFQGNDAQSIFARLGIVTAIPSTRLHQFEQYLATIRAASTATPVASGSGFITMKCACGRVDGQSSMTWESAEEYRTKNIKFQCYKCLDAEKASRAMSTLYSK